jgi:4-hydroxy-2-oxoheptanedioate aldolase
VSARDVLHTGGSAIGLWATIPSPVSAELAARSGADYVVVDQQHGAVGPGELLAMLQAIQGAGRPALVRVGSHDPWVIGHALDLGAAGVIVPLVDGPEEAAAVVAACRYAPEGRRSWGRVRGEADGEPLVLAMIETRAGLDAVDEIVVTPGLDGVYIGPSDLSLGLGARPARQIEHPAVLEAIGRVRAATEYAGVLCGLHCLDAADAARFSHEGFPMVTAGSDAGFLRERLAEVMATARGRG